MTKQEINDLLKTILKDLEMATKLSLEQSGVKKSSNLSKSVKYIVVKESIDLEVAYYYPFVSTGRKPGVRKVPIKALIEYIKRGGFAMKSGQTINQLAFAIQTSIYKHGINPKNYIDKVMNVAGDVAQEEIADGLMTEIGDELETMFEI